MELNNASLREALDRIVSLYGTDEGFFILALHSFMEAYADARSPDIQYSSSFREKIHLLYRHLGWKFDTPRPKLIPLLCQEHLCTHEVRHGFSRRSTEEVIAAVRNFLEFCHDIDLHDPKIDTLKDGLALWEDKQTPLDRQRELVKLRHELQQFSKENRELYQKAVLAATTREEFETLNARLQEKFRDQEELQRRLQSKKEKSDRLRACLHTMKEENKQLAGELKQMEITRAYYSYLERYTAYTRTRGDYERSVIRMTPEQVRAVERIKETGDYLVRGPAGTGKTLVLLHALDEQLSLHDASLPFAQQEKLVLLTYTNSLVRFNAYLSSILSKRTSQPTIETVDTFFNTALREIDSSYAVRYSIIEELLESHELPFLNEKELKEEIESAIFGRNLDRESYINSPGARTGMKGTLSKKQKQQVWEIAEVLRDHMLSTKVLSKNFSRLVLLEALMADEQLRARISIRRLFVDEVQDLSPIETKLLGLLSESGVVLAGDEQQAIYQAGFSFRQLGVNVMGRSVLLSGNYRNTRQISMLAEMYRSITGLAALNRNPYAFREGPSPELWQEEDEVLLAETLTRRVQFFLSVLEYEPENIAVLVSRSSMVDMMRKKFSEKGFATHNIKDSDFDFHATPGIRLSTFHSAKGVEFPVVMLYAPQLPVSSRISRESAEKSCRCLVYMAMTRAMENLQVFMVDTPEQLPAQEMLQAFADYRACELQDDHENLDDATK